MRRMQKERIKRPMCHQHTVSNTGFTGLSKVQWNRYRRDGSARIVRSIIVSWHESVNDPKRARFYYGTKRSYEEALKLALERRRLALESRARREVSVNGA